MNVTQRQMNWQQLATNSPYQTAEAIRQELNSGKIESAIAGVEELIEALSRSDKRALKSQLVRLIKHIIKWNSQPDKRSLSWVASINNAREEILEIQQETPSLNNAVIQSMWANCTKVAKREAEGEMNQKSNLQILSWQQVFEDQYEL